MHYNYEGIKLVSAHPGNVIVDCISLGLYNMFREPLDQHKDGSEAMDFETKIFQSVREVVCVFSDFVDKAIFHNQQVRPTGHLLRDEFL